MISADVTRGDDHERRLLQYLLSGYDRSVRPSQDAAKPLNVTFGMALTQIIDVVRMPGDNAHRTPLECQINYVVRIHGYNAHRMPLQY